MTSKPSEYLKTPELDWHDLKTGMPTEADADPYGCIFIWDNLNGVRIVGWRNTYEIGRQYVTHWARIPDGPQNRMDLREAESYQGGIARDGHKSYYAPRDEDDQE